jgi:hypothetical protein
VTADFEQLVVFQKQDAVGHADGAETVTDEYTVLSFMSSVKRLFAGWQL